MTRRTFRTFTAATTLCLSAALMACSPGTTEEDTAAPSGDGTIDPAEFEGKTLEYVYFTDGPDEEATRELIADFEEETGATVELSIVPFDGLEQTLQSRISGGNSPDVARVANWRPYEDVLIDMTGYFGEDYPDQFIEGMAAGAVGAEGGMLAVPSDQTMNGPLVNVAAFEKAGVELPTAESPWDWESMIADLEKVHQANDMEFAFAIDKSGHRISTVLNQFGTYFFDTEGGVALDDAKAVEALGKLDDLMQSGAASKDFWLEQGSRYAGANEIFLAEEVPLYLSGNWQVGLFAEAAEFDWAAVPNPCGENCGGFPGGKYMVAFEDGPEPELAAYFVEWMNRTENQEKIDQLASWLPTRNDLVESGIEYPNRGEDMSVFLADVAETPEEAYATAAHPGFDEAATVLIEEYDKTVAGQQDVEATVSNLHATLDELAAG